MKWVFSASEDDIVAAMISVWEYFWALLVRNIVCPSLAGYLLRFFGFLC